MKNDCPNSSCYEAALRDVAYWVNLPEGYNGRSVVVGVVSFNGQNVRVVHEHGYYNEDISRINSAPLANAPKWSSRH